MCGRYILVLEPGDWVHLIPNPDPGTIAAYERENRIIERAEGWTDRPRKPVFESYNIAPTQRAPIITNRDGGADFELARWGLIPRWAKPDKIPRNTFNARDDRLGESGMWRGLVRNKRCLVPASGFYEWTGPKGKRAPHFIHDAGGAQFAFAGLFDDWTDSDTGEVVTSYSIITTSPNELMTRIHDRMPVILQDSEGQTLWIDPATDSLDGVKHLMGPMEWEGFDEYEVPPLKGDGPELIRAKGN